MTPRLCFLSILGATGRYDPKVYADEPGGDDETVWIAHLLQREGLAERVDYWGIKVAQGEPLPGHETADLFLLGGSYHSVHERLDWQAAVSDWLRGARTAGAPVLGICGGHQMMAEAVGGAVGPVTSAPMAGSLEIRLTAEGRDHPMFQGRDDPPVYHFANYEHVTAVPVDVRILATTSTMPHVALDYGGGWWSVQFHPESTERSMAAAWAGSAPERARAYRPLPKCGRVVRAFVRTFGRTFGARAQNA